MGSNQIEFIGLFAIFVIFVIVMLAMFFHPDNPWITRETRIKNKLRKLDSDTQKEYIDAWEEDTKAIRSDWEAVGKDIESVIGKHD